MNATDRRLKQVQKKLIGLGSLIKIHHIVPTLKF